MINVMQPTLGKEELKAIEERLAAHANLFYPVD